MPPKTKTLDTNTERPVTRQRSALPAPITFAVDADEAIWFLDEPIIHGQRWQVLTVNRNDELAEFWTCLGSNDGRQPLQIMADGDEDTVAEVRAIADAARDEDWGSTIIEEQGPSNIIARYFEMQIEKYRLSRGQSTFWAGGKVERNV